MDRSPYNFVASMNKVIEQISNIFHDTFDFILNDSGYKNYFIQTDGKLYSPKRNIAYEYGPVSGLKKYSNIRYHKIRKCLCGSKTLPHFTVKYGYPAIVCDSCKHSAYYFDSRNVGASKDNSHNDTIKKLEIRVWNRSVSSAPLEVLNAL